MTAADFTLWVRGVFVSRGWREKDCAAALGCGKNMVTVWKQNGAPLYIGLACRALSEDLTPWTSPE